MFADCDFGEMDKFCNTYGDEDDEDEETLRARTSLRMLWALGGGAVRFEGLAAKGFLGWKSMISTA